MNAPLHTSEALLVIGMLCYKLDIDNILTLSTNLDLVVCRVVIVMIMKLLTPQQKGLHHPSSMTLTEY